MRDFQGLRAVAALAAMVVAGSALAAPNAFDHFRKICPCEECKAKRAEEG